MKTILFPALALAAGTLIFTACSTKKDAGVSENQLSAQSPNCGPDGFDTSRYIAVYNKNNSLLLVPKKPNAFKSTEHIDPKIATDMISTHLKPFVTVDGELHAEVSRYVDFNISKLMELYTDYVSAGQTPDSLRIYFGEYNSNNAPEVGYRGKMTTILVGIKGQTDIYDATEKKLWPVNIGTLCPPDCVKEDDINDDSKGAIFAKKGARNAGAIKWDLE